MRGAASIRQGMRRRSRAALFGLCMVGVTLATQSPQAFGEPGRLDPTFGVRGKAIAALDFGDPRFWYSTKVHAVRAPSGGFLVAGNELIVRYTPRGRLDRSFAKEGLLRAESVEGEALEIAGLAVDPRGRIVVAGTAAGRTAILRFSPNGDPDLGFGEGDGAVITDFGLPPPLNTTLPGGSLGVSDVTVDAAGRIVVLGTTLWSLFYSAEFRSYVGRLTEGGAIDSTFASNGVFAFEHASLPGVGELVLDAGGGPLMVDYNPGYRGSAGLGPLLHRLDASGSVDETVSSKGFLGIGEAPQGIALDDRERILLLLGKHLWRLLPSGAPDPSFGRGGVSRLPVRGARSSFADVAVTPDGGALAIGTQVHYFEGKPEPRRRLVLARLGPRGALDRRFGDRGLVRARFGRPSNMAGRQVLLDGESHALAIGVVRNRRLPTGQGLVALRYELGG